MIYFFLCFLSCDNKSQYTDVVEVEEDLDADLDGYLASEDCDDTDPYVHPNATEVCDGLDNDCDGDVDEGVLNTYYMDADGDGYLSDEDCDDLSPLVHPGADEICDGIDNDCDGSLDEGTLETFYEDADDDYNASIEFEDEGEDIIDFTETNPFGTF